MPLSARARHDRCDLLSGVLLPLGLVVAEFVDELVSNLGPLLGRRKHFALGALTKPLALDRVIDGRSLVGTLDAKRLREWDRNISRFADALCQILQ